MCRWIVLFPGLLACTGGAEVPLASGSLDERVFLWQRAITPEVVASARRGHGELGPLIVLAAEVDAAGQPQAMDFGKPEVLGSFQEVGIDAMWLCFRFADVQGLDLAGSLIPGATRAVEAAGIRVAGIVLDVDVPTSKLAEYGTRLTQIRTLTEGRPLEVLGLPTWTNSEGMGLVLEASDRVILQVHGLSVEPSGSPRVFSGSQAMADIAAFAELDHPFSVSLPTYGHALRSGLVRAEPAEVATLVRSLRELRSAWLTDLCWFRLPVPGDALAWTWPALNAVRKGEVPAAIAGAELRPTPDPLVFDLWIRGEGADGGPAPRLVLASDVPFAAAETTPDYEWEPNGREGTLQPSLGTYLAPGLPRSIGWVRLSAPGRVALHVDPPPPGEHHAH
jgi:hypothetical protein